MGRTQGERQRGKSHCAAREGRRHDYLAGWLPGCGVSGSSGGLAGPDLRGLGAVASACTRRSGVGSNLAHRRHALAVLFVTNPTNRPRTAHLHLPAVATLLDLWSGEKLDGVGQEWRLRWRLTQPEFWRCANVVRRTPDLVDFDPYQFRNLMDFGRCLRVRSRGRLYVIYENERVLKGFHSLGECTRSRLATDQPIPKQWPVSC